MGKDPLTDFNIKPSDVRDKDLTSGDADVKLGLFEADDANKAPDFSEPPRYVPSDDLKGL